MRKSLVLLKNHDGLLPLRPDMHVLVAGDGAHNIGKQAGGWTLSWQGTGNLNEHFPNGMSIYEGLKAVIEAGGGTARLSEDGSFTGAPDVAIVVFGEQPYAEYQGDRLSVDYAADDGLELLRKFQGAGIPTVSVFLSGRPLWVNPEINASDAFVATLGRWRHCRCAGRQRRWFPALRFPWPPGVFLARDRRRCRGQCR